jgi:hypothetical protein
MKHAELIKAVADGAMVQECATGAVIWSLPMGGASAIKAMVTRPGHEFRLAVATIKVGEREINAPLTTKPKHGEIYYSVQRDGHAIEMEWNDKGDSIDLACFHGANCWRTEADALTYVAARAALVFGEPK